MVGLQKLREYEALTPSQQKYCIEWLTACIGFPIDGTTDSHPDKQHAEWAIKEFESAVNAAKKQV